MSKDRAEKLLVKALRIKYIAANYELLLREDIGLERKCNTTAVFILLARPPLFQRDTESLGSAQGFLRWRKV